MSKNITFLPSVLKAVLPFVSQEETRYYLQGCLIEKGIFIATDGHRLAAVKPELFIGLADNFILPTETIKQILSVKPQSKKIPLYVTLDTEKKTATIHHGKDEEQGIIRLATFDYKPIVGTYPDWKRIIPKKESFDKPTQTSFNASYLRTFSSLGSQLRFKMNNDATGPSIVQSKTEEWEAFGVIMPMRDNAPDAFPNWVL